VGIDGKELGIEPLITNHDLDSGACLTLIEQDRLRIGNPPPISHVGVNAALMGLTYGPLGTALTELYPTAVCDTGASLSFNLAGIVGASLAPYIATWLATHYGLAYVGYYLSAEGLLTLIALMLLRKSGQGLSSDGALA
jgi:hypothetical protein